MFSLRGAPALTDARRRRLLQNLRGSFPSLRDLDTEWVFFVDTNRALKGRDREILDALVRENHAGSSEAGESLPAGTTETYVVPRLGTISPWSSKATEIVHRCGLSAINRIERGTIYRFTEDADASPLTDLSLIHI